MRKLFAILLLSIVTSLTGLSAQSQDTLHLRGRVLDSTGLPMASVTVKVYRGTGVPAANAEPAKEGLTNLVGDFDIELPAGEYRIDVSAPDFNTFQQSVQLAADTPPLAVTLSVKIIETVVNVTGGQAEIGVDSESSLTTDVITGADLDNLPENEEDLLAYLEQLASARGIVDGELNIRVDGFEGTRLPNRAEISEIRIINNSFSAESNTTGPRIEIVTRPGTGFWTGNLGFTFNDESLNAAAPLTGRKPAAQTRNVNGGVRGPIIPGKITTTLNVTSQERENEGSAIRAVGINGPVNQGVTSLSKSRSITFGPNVTLSRRHTVVGNFNYSTNSNANSGVGGFNLPERASNRDGTNWSLQLTERATMSGRFQNELRFQIRHSESKTTPVTDAMAINVTDSFNGGGATNRSEDRNKDFMVANQFRWQVARTLTLTSAVQIDYHRTFSNSQNNYNGTYTFASLHDYCWAENFPGTNCGETKAIIEAAQLAGTTPLIPNTTIPIDGVPTQYSVTFGEDSILRVNQGELSAFLQGEWRLSPRAQLSFGARYQAQQHLKDYNNVAPTGGLSYQLSTKQNWQTVVRVGARMNYNTFGLNSWEQLVRNDGESHQFTTLITFPSYPNPNLSASKELSSVANSYRTRAEDYVAPYSIQPSISLDQTLPRGHRFSFTFQINRGVHQPRNRNINAPFPGTPLDDDLVAQLSSRNVAVRNAARELVDQMRPFYPLKQNITQMESTGKSRSENFSVQYRINNKAILWNKVQIGGNVSWAMNWASDDNGTPMNNYDLAAEWGRSSQDQRHRVSTNLNVRIPWNMQFTINPGWSSGRPYNITTGRDQNGDGANNDRPLGFTKNSATGPSNFNPLTLRFTKTFTFAQRPVVVANNYAEPQRGGGGFGGGGGGGGFGGGPGGGGPGGGFGGPGGGPGGPGGRGRPDTRQIQLNVTVNNLFNSTTRTGISGVMSSPLFGQLTGGGQGRTIQIGLTTNLGRLF